MPRKPAMTVRFWGVRGSIASPGSTTVRYGGNTACVSVGVGKKRLVVLDAGTGIRPLGNTLQASAETIFVLLSHSHWDHIQGFPFFSPIYEPKRTVYVFPPLDGKAQWCPALRQMDGAHFPVTPDRLPSRTSCITDGGMDLLAAYGLCITPIPTNHPRWRVRLSY